MTSDYDDLGVYFYVFEAKESNRPHVKRHNIHINGDILIKYSAYLTSLVTPYAPTRSLRSAAHRSLTIPRYNLERCCRRAFSVAGPSLWNDLPVTIREAGTLTTFKAAFTLDPVLFRILANRTRRVDLAPGLHSHYKRLTRRERYAPTSPCTHCVCFATGCNPTTCT